MNELKQVLERGLRVLLRITAKTLITDITTRTNVFTRLSCDVTKTSSDISMPKSQSNKLVLTIEEIANLLGLSRSSTYEAVRKGQIPSIRIGKRIIIPRTALIKILSSVGE